MNVVQRQLEPEIMDDPLLDEARHIGALQGLERLNRFSNSAGILWSPIRAFVKREGLLKCRLLDVATGAGDVPLELWRRARRAGIDLQMAGCDKSSRAVAYARRRSEKIGASVHFFELDAISSELPSGYDVIVSSLFLHHIEDMQAVRLLQAMARSAGRLVLVSDLVRHPAALGLAIIGTRLLSTSDVVHHDGPQSVRAAFTIDEVSALAHRAGLAGARVTSCWPFRLLLTWRRPG